MSTSEQPQSEPAALSSVRIETNSRGYAQIKVCCYDGVQSEEMQRLSDLALSVYDDTVLALGKRAAKPA